MSRFSRKVEFEDALSCELVHGIDNVRDGGLR
jgi:hypothetical protein